MNQRRGGKGAREGAREPTDDEAQNAVRLPRSLLAPSSSRRGFLLADCEIARACAAKVPLRTI